MDVQDKIKLTVFQLNQLKSILNHNLKAVESVNTLYIETPTITQHLTFFIPNEQYNNSNDSHRDAITGELTRIIKAIDIFTTKETILNYYRQLLKEVFFNAVTEEKARIYKSNDIDRIFQYDSNREFVDLWGYMDKYIIYKEGKFILIPNYKTLISSYYTHDKITNKTI